MPGTEMGCRVKECVRVRLASQRSRKAFGFVDEVEPRVHHATAGVLSEAHQMASLWMSACWANMEQPRMIAANSKSLFDKVPVGFADDIKRDCMSVGKAYRKAIGWSMWPNRVGTQKPPIPCCDASTAPMKAGARGTRLAMGTGWEASVLANSRQSCRALWTKGLRRTRVAFGWSVSTLWRIEKR